MATKRERKTTQQVRVADPKTAMAALDKIRKRDAELLKRLAK